MPSFEAELGRAVALGRMSLDLADISVLDRHKDIDDARRSAMEVRRSIKVWAHIKKQLAVRIAEVAREQIRAKAPKNVILAHAHEVNRSQTLTEEEVGQIVLEQVYAALPSEPRPARRGR